MSAIIVCGCVKIATSSAGLSPFATVRLAARIFLLGGSISQYLPPHTRALRGYGQVDPAARLMALSAPFPLGKTISLRIALFLLEPQRVEIGILYHEAKPDGLPCNLGQWLIRSGLGMTTLPPYRMLDLIPEDQG